MTPHSSSRISVLFSLLLWLGSTFAPPPLAAAVSVVTTTTDLQAIVQAVGGERVRVTSIGKGHEDPHYVEPKPSYMTQLARARLLFCIGLDLEIWLKPLTEGARNLLIQPGGLGYIDCSQVIEVKEIPTVRVDPSMGDIHPSGNPHYWLDPLNGAHIADLVAQKLAEVDPAGAAGFQKNAREFRAEIERRLPGWRERLVGFANRSIACFHSSWVYFADAFDLRIIGYVEPRPGIPPTGRELAALVARMKAEKTKVVLRENYHSDRFANMVADKVQGTVLLMPTSVGATPALKTYFDLFDALIDKVAHGLAHQQ
jgi:zinc/manganese transport system substrate-binding protein